MALITVNALAQWRPGPPNPIVPRNYRDTNFEKDIFVLCVPKILKMITNGRIVFSRVLCEEDVLAFILLFYLKF